MVFKSISRAAFFVAALFCLLLCPHAAWAWGAGHEDQLRLIVQVLPPQIKAFFPPDVLQQLIMKYSHYPDSFEPVDPAAVGPEATALLQTYKVTTRYTFHSDLGKALSFTLLVQAFREHNPAHAAIWMGALCHAIGDECAINHDPLVHYLLYGFESYQLKMGKGVGLDLSNVARSPDGMADLQKLLAGFQPTVLSEDPADAVVKVMMNGPEGNAFMTQLGRRITASYALNASPAAQADAVEAVAESGAEGTRRAACAVLTAWQFAQENKDVVLTPDIFARYDKESAAFIHNRPLANDSIYTGLLDPPAAQSGKGAPVGVLLEPSQTMNARVFSYGGKYILAGAMRAMQDSGIAYRVIDVRSLDAADLPAPADMPVLIVCAGRFGVSSAALTRLKSYTSAGGKLFYIGGVGSDRGVLGPLSDALVKGADKLWPIAPEDLPKSAIKFDGAFATALGDHPYPIVNSPNTPAGWQRPESPYHLVTTNSTIQVLAEIRDGGQSLPVAGALADASGVIRDIVVPEYLMAPYIVSGDDVLADPSTPALDSVGKKILIESLRLLAPTSLDQTASIRALRQ